MAKVGFELILLTSVLHLLLYTPFLEADQSLYPTPLLGAFTISGACSELGRLPSAGLPPLSKQRLPIQILIRVFYF